MKVKKNDYSNDKRTTIGLPQGGVLLPIMWFIMIWGLKEYLQKMGEDLAEIFLEAYADDIAICHWGLNREEVGQRHKGTINKIKEYFKEAHLQ